MRIQRENKIAKQKKKEKGDQSNSPKPYTTHTVSQPHTAYPGERRTMSSSDSSFSSFFSSSLGASAVAAGAPPAAAAAGAAPTAGAPPLAPTFDSRSFTFLPSRALARSVAQMGSRSMSAAFVNATILSACHHGDESSSVGRMGGDPGKDVP